MLKRLRNINFTQSKHRNDGSTPSAIRRIILGIFLLAAFGMGTELLLLEHTDGVWQSVPLVLFVISIVVLGLHAVVRGAASIRIFQVVMVLFIVSGIIGIGLHYQAKEEFKLEMNPDMEGLKLFREVIKGASLPPVLAPGMMIQLGLLGLAYTYRHPVLFTCNEKNAIVNKELKQGVIKNG